MSKINDFETMSSITSRIAYKSKKGEDISADLKELIETNSKILAEKKALQDDANRFEKDFFINISVKRDDGKDIDQAHLEALEESCFDRAVSQINEGYQSGELIDNITMSDEDGPEGVSYRGWWALQ